MTKFRFLALFAALALLLTVSTTVLAQAPKQPNVFTGEVMIGDEMAMDGTMVTAMIDGETVGMAEVMDGMYSIKLDPGDPSAEGYMDFSGKMVMFMVGMAGAFFGVYTLDFVSEASGLATYDSENNFARWLVVSSVAAAFAGYMTFQRSRSPRPPNKEHDLTVINLGMDRTNRDG